MKMAADQKRKRASIWKIIKTAMTPVPLRERTFLVTAAPIAPGRVDGGRSRNEANPAGNTRTIPAPNKAGKAGRTRRRLYRAAREFANRDPRRTST